MSVHQSVSDIINEAGEAVTVRHYAAGSRNVSTGEFTRTYTDYAITAGVRHYTPKEIRGEIRQGDRMVRIAAIDLSFTPSQEDEIIVNGETLNIYAVNVRKFQNENAIYICSVRGS